MIRPANPDDSEQIENIIQKVWNERIDHQIFQAQTQRKTSTILVAIEEGQIAGFVSTFLTIDCNGIRRWEIDLLVVRPESQGKGLGSALVKNTWKDAQRNHADLSRALIRTENIPSQKAFERANFYTDGRIHQLYLWSPQISSENLEPLDGVTLLPMDTLTYRGLWIEGLISPAISDKKQEHIITKARHSAASEGRLNTGALVPQDDDHHLAAVIQKTGSIHGDYCWWVKSLKD